eukprot:gene26858-32459_t
MTGSMKVDEIVEAEKAPQKETKITAGTKNNYLIAPISGIIEVTVSHPLDRIKTKMQEMSLSNRTPKVIPAAKEIHLTTGWKGFYAGYTARVLGIMPMRLVYWETMRNMNKRVEGEPRWFQLIIPGIAVGVAQTLIDNPIEVLKVRRMTGESKTAINSIFKGYMPTLYRNIIFSITVSAAVKTFGEEQPFFSAAMGGLIGSIISQPLDVAKTEMQRFKAVADAKPKGMVAILVDVAKKNPKELFSGGLMRSAMGFVNMGVGFLAFKHIYNLVSQY